MPNRASEKEPLEQIPLSMRLMAGLSRRKESASMLCRAFLIVMSLCQTWTLQCFVWNSKFWYGMWDSLFILTEKRGYCVLLVWIAEIGKQNKSQCLLMLYGFFCIEQKP